MAIPVHTVAGAEIPEVGLGTWRLRGRQCVETVRTALDLGYRHVDTAQLYGNEAEVGRGMCEAEVDRDEVFLATKVSRSNLEFDDVIDSVQASLERLDTAYVDLLLIHWPHPRRSVEETLSAMAQLRDDGKAHHLGVCNFTRSQLEHARRVTERPLVTDQVLYNPTKDQSDLRAYCLDHDLALTAYSPLAHGGLIGNRTLAAIGRRYDKTGPQVAIRWLIQQPGVVTIPKATSRDHLQENLDVFDFELTEGEIRQVSNVRPGLRNRLFNLGPALMRWNPM